MKKDEATHLKMSLMMKLVYRDKLHQQIFAVK